MTMPVHLLTAEQLVAATSLEVLRRDAESRIDQNATLTLRDKQLAKRELEFLLEYERLRRLRRAVYQWKSERREELYRIIVRREEVQNQVRLSRAETAREVARLNHEIVQWKLDTVERIRRLRPKDDFAAHVRQARLGLLKLKLQQIMARRREEYLADSIDSQVLRRGRFLLRVREQYPDMADELIDYYDRLQFEHGDRSE